MIDGDHHRFHANAQLWGKSISIFEFECEPQSEVKWRRCFELNWSKTDIVFRLVVYYVLTGFSPNYWHGIMAFAFSQITWSSGQQSDHNTITFKRNQLMIIINIIQNGSEFANWLMHLYSTDEGERDTPSFFLFFLTLSLHHLLCFKAKSCARM